MLTTEEFVARARGVHGDKYDYSRAEYTAYGKKVCIICPTHGEFWQNPQSHLNGNGCPACAGLKRRTTEEFVKKAQKIHGSKYDYSKTRYINKRTKLTITCPIHGDFLQAPNNHLRGQGCPECGKLIAAARQNNSRNHRKGSEEFQEELDAKFEGKYEVIGAYINNKTSIEMFCHAIGKDGNEHGAFSVRPDSILNGYGCQKCKKELLSRNRPKKKPSPRKRKPRIKSIESVEAQIKEKYPTVEIVDKSEYRNTSTPLSFKCLKCGAIFERKPNTFLCARLRDACPVCSLNKQRKNRTKTHEEFEKEVNLRYGEGKYTILSKYRASSAKVEVLCHDCGRTFFVEANSFLHGHGCPYHNCNSSGKEKEVFEFVKGICSDAENNNRKLLNGYELDMVIPSKKIAIEFDGIFWHNENNKTADYHLKKTEACGAIGYRLIHVFEDEWRDKKEIWKSLLQRILGASMDAIDAKDCRAKFLLSQECSQFLNQNHLLGDCNSEYRYGLFHGAELVAVMTLASINGTDFELLRYGDKNGLTVKGGTSVLFNLFVQENRPKTVTFQADRRFDNGKLSMDLGFSFLRNTEPEFSLVIKGKRFSPSDLYCPEGTEKEVFWKEQHWYRIYDCGKSVFKLKF